jgi:hypothetical protein
MSPMQKRCAWLVGSSPIIAALTDKAAKLTSVHPAAQVIADYGPLTALLMGLSGAVGFVVIHLWQKYISEISYTMGGSDLTSVRVQTREQLDWVAEFSVSKFGDRVAGRSKTSE